MNQLQSLSTERSLLGSILCTPELMDYAIDNITYVVFYDTYLSTIYRLMCEKHTEGVRPDVSILHDELCPIGQGRLMELLECATTTNITDYCKSLNELHILRRLVLKFRVLAQNIDENAVKLPDIGKEIKNILDETDIQHKRRGKLVTVDSFKQNVIEYYENGFKNIGVSTGWEELDKHYRPAKGTLNIITGIPGHGKSEFLDALIVNISTEKDWKWAVFSPENFPYELHVQKLAEKLITKPMMRKDRMNKIELESAIEWINNHIIFIQPSEDNISLDAILRLQLEAIEKYKIDATIIDPWNEIEIKLQPGESETDYIGRALSKTRRFARNHNILYYIVAHPAKMYKDKNNQYNVPTMYNISGSAHWYNKADNGICVHRDFENNIVDIHIQKIKFKIHGYVGCVPMKYEKSNGRFEVDNSF